MASIQYTALRLWSILKKEFIQIKRDYVTYILLIMVPFGEVILFGFIMNTDAKNLPAIIVSHDNSQFTNSIIQAFKNTEYYAIKDVITDEREAEKLLKSGTTQLVVNIPVNFSRDLIKGKQPHILLEGDASDPVAVSNAFHAGAIVINEALRFDLIGPLKYLSSANRDSFVVDTHAKYNPSRLAQYHTLPGLLVTVLTITLVMITAISITTEYEHGTMELLLITPLTPLEVILGKIIPHVILGFILFYLTLALAYFLFHVPFFGSLVLLSFTALPFILANLSVGVTVSTIARTQFRAANITNTYTLPSVLLSGFMFPFYAMPPWAQFIGNLFPGTHFLRISYAIILKGSGFSAILPDLLAIIAFLLIMIGISFKFYRRTLD